MFICIQCSRPRKSNCCITAIKSLLNKTHKTKNKAALKHAILFPFQHGITVSGANLTTEYVRISRRNVDLGSNQVYTDLILFFF